MPQVHGRPTDESERIDDRGKEPVEVRIRRFGQYDHVRLYGDDLVERLGAAGFTVIREISWKDLSAEEETLYRTRSVGGYADDANLIAAYTV